MVAKDLRCVLILAMIALVAAWSSPAGAQQRPFSLHWVVGSIQDDAWSYRIDFRGLPIHRDIAVLGQGNLGTYPYGGPHLIDADPNFMARHLAKVRDDVQRWIPDPNYAGLVWIDYEEWWPIWQWTIDVPGGSDPAAHDYDFQTDWREHMRLRHSDLLTGLTPEQQEQVMIDRYEQVARTFYEQTILQCKALRPSAKFGYFCIPPINFYAALNSPEECRQINDQRLGWLWEASDVLFPSTYQFMEAVERPDGSPYERDLFIAQTNKVPAIDNERWMRFVMSEAVRVARGKPVYAVVWSKYNGRDAVNNPEFIADLNIRQMIDVPKELGVDGLVIWDYFYNWQQFLEFRDFFDRKFGPHLVGVLSSAERANVNFRLNSVVATPDGRAITVRDAAPPPPGNPTSEPPPPEPAPAPGTPANPGRADPERADQPAHPGTLDTRVRPRRLSGIPFGAGDRASMADLTPRPTEPTPEQRAKAAFDKPPVVIGAGSTTVGRPTDGTVVIPIRGAISNGVPAVLPPGAKPGEIVIVKP